MNKLFFSAKNRHFGDFTGRRIPRRSGVKMCLGAGGRHEFSRGIARPALLCIASLAVIAVVGLRAAQAADAYDRGRFSQDQAAAERLVETLPVSEVLGPLSPVALSPFFGLTCLSGLSILSSNEMLPLPENAFIDGNPVLNNGWVFAAFLGLTVLTSLPKFTTPTKAVAEIADQAETYAGIISYGVIFLLAAQAAQGPGPEPGAVVYQAGIFTLGRQTLLIVAIALNIFVINTVKFFFELLVLISPIPMLDAMFEVANKSVAGALAALYALSPKIAFAVNVVIFLLCLALFNFARRRVRYLKAMILDPLAVKLFNISDPDRRAAALVPRELGAAAPLCKCFPDKRIGKAKRKDLCYLVRTDSGYALLKPRLFGRSQVQTLGMKNARVCEGIVHHSIEFEDQMDRPRKLLFSRVYTDRLAQFRALVEGGSGGEA